MWPCTFRQKKSLPLWMAPQQPKVQRRIWTWLWYFKLIATSCEDVCQTQHLLKVWLVMGWRLLRARWMSSIGGRGRKKKGIAETGPSPDGDTCMQVPPHKRNLYYLSVPVLAFITFIRLLTLNFGGLFVRLFKRIPRAMATAPRRPDDQSCKEHDGISEQIRNYHKQAFEHISKALKIDEDDKGRQFHTLHSQSISRGNLITGRVIFT